MGGHPRGQERLTTARGLFTSGQASLRHEFGLIGDDSHSERVVMGDEKWQIVSVVDRGGASSSACATSTSTA